MTQQEALTEARKRWARATAQEFPSKRNRYAVGVLSITRSDFRMKGQGVTWEAAFADASRRQAEKGGEQ